MLKLYNQSDRVTCAACAYATLLSGLNINISEKQACDECLTDKKGTFDTDVFHAILKRKIEANFVYINQSFKEYGRWLYLNSRDRFIFVSCHFISNSGRGRNKNDYHAVVCSDGMIYDSAYKEIIPLEIYTFKYNKQFIIRSIILVDNPYPEKRNKGFDIDE